MAKIEKKQLNKTEFLRTLKYIFFSVSAGIVQSISFTLMQEVLFPGQSYRFYAYPSLILSVVWNFTFNRQFTYQSASNVKVAMLKTLYYYIIFAPLSIELGELYLVQTLNWNYYVIFVATMLINFVTEFIYQRFYVFAKSIDTNKRAKEKVRKAQELNEKQENK